MKRDPRAPIKFKMISREELQVEGGSVNRYELKSCYMLIKGSMESLSDEHKSNLRHFLTRVRQVVDTGVKRSKFGHNYIMDPMIKESFVKNGECFFTIEFNFFMDGLRKAEIINELEKIVELIFNNVVRVDKNFKFSKYTRSFKLKQL
jgi:hypothetical protein